MANRGEGAFQLIELWIENRFMVELMTSEMTEAYIELMQPRGWADWLGIPLPERAGSEGLEIAAKLPEGQMEIPGPFSLPS